MPLIHYLLGNIHDEDADRKAVLHGSAVFGVLLAWKNEAAHFIRDFLVYSEIIACPRINRPTAS